MNIDDKIRGNEVDCDHFFNHYEAFSASNRSFGWIEIAAEARRLMSILSGFEVEQDSIIDGCISGAVVGAENAALFRVAAMLGVDAEAFAEVMYEYDVGCGAWTAEKLASELASAQQALRQVAS